MSADKPQLYIVAGPSGAGKSSVFNSSENVALQSVDRFNIDDRLAQLNNGSYQNIPNELRPQVNAELANFIRSHVEQGRSLSTETTLRHPSLLNWTERATASGFEANVIYVAADNAEIHVQRVEERAVRGGHSASPEVIRDIYEKSVANVPRILELAEQGSVTRVEIFDNSGSSPVRQIAIDRGYVGTISTNIAPWVEQALANTKYAVPELRQTEGHHLASIDLAKQQERREAPLLQNVSAGEAQGFRWVAQTGDIHSYRHLETERHIHVDGRSGQFYDQQRNPVSRETALQNALPSRDEGLGLGR